jgi:hypothetical protein
VETASTKQIMSTCDGDGGYHSRRVIDYGYHEYVVISKNYEKLSDTTIMKQQ